MYFLIYQLLHLSNDHHFKGSPYSTSAKIATFGVESLRRDTVAYVFRNWRQTVFSLLESKYLSTMYYPVFTCCSLCFDIFISAGFISFLCPCFSLSTLQPKHCFQM